VLPGVELKGLPAWVVHCEQGTACMSVILTITTIHIAAPVHRARPADCRPDVTPQRIQLITTRGFHGIYHLSPLAAYTSPYRQLLSPTLIAHTVRFMT